MRGVTILIALAAAATITAWIAVRRTMFTRRAMSLAWPQDIGPDEVYRYAKYYLRESGWQMLEGWHFAGIRLRATKDRQILNAIIANPRSTSLKNAMFDATNNSLKLNTVITVLVHGLAENEVEALEPTHNICVMHTDDLPRAAEILQDFALEAAADVATAGDPVRLESHAENEVDAVAGQDIQIAPVEHTTPPPSSIIKGLVGHISGTRVWGWAYCPDDPGEHLTIDVSESGEVIATGRADLFRANLQEAGIGDGDHAFDIDFGGDAPEVDPEQLILTAARPNGQRADLRVAPHAAEALRKRRAGERAALNLRLP